MIQVFRPFVMTLRWFESTLGSFSLNEMIWNDAHLSIEGLRWGQETGLQGSETGLSSDKDPGKPKKTFLLHKRCRKNLHHSETEEFCDSQDKLSPLILGKRCNQEPSIQIENEGRKLSETTVKVLFNPCSFSASTRIALQDLKETGRKQHKHQRS